MAEHAATAKEQAQDHVLVQGWVIFSKLLNDQLVPYTEKRPGCQANKDHNEPNTNVLPPHETFPKDADVILHIIFGEWLGGLSNPVTTSLNDSISSLSIIILTMMAR